MMIKLGLKNNEQELPFIGRTLTIDDNIIYKEQRTVSGKLTRDIIAIKKQFTIKYSIIEHIIITYLLNLQALNTTLSLIIDLNGDIIQYDVLIDSFSRTRELITNQTTYWSDVTLVLKEV